MLFLYSAQHLAARWFPILARCNGDSVLYPIEA
jgi:hypothetical protein